MLLFAFVFLLANVFIRADILPLWSTSLLDDISSDTVSLKYVGPTPRLLSNCEGTAQVYLHVYVYLSQNGFTTPMAPMGIPSSLLHVDDPVVQTAVVRSDSIALLINRTVFIYTLQTGDYHEVIVPVGLYKVMVDDPVVQTAVVRSDSIAFLINGTVFIYTLQTGDYHEVIVPPGYRVTALEFSQYCCLHAWCEDWSDAVVAVGKLDVPGGSTINRIFVLEKGETEFHGTPLPDGADELELLAAVPILPWHSVALLLMKQYQGEQTREAFFNYLHIPFKGRHPEQTDNHTISSMRAITYTHHGDDLRVVHLTNRFGEFLMWGQRELFISKSAGQAVFRASEEIKEHFDQDDYIQELVPGANGDFAFLTSEGRLFYGRSNLETHIAELHIEDKVDSNSAIIFDKQSNIYIMNAQHYDLDSRNASTDNLVYLSSDLIYPSEVLQEGQGHDLPTCPFLLFTAQFGSELFYIDIGHSLVLRASFIPSLWQNSNIMVYPSNPSIITVNTSLTAGDPIGHGLKKVEVSANISLTGDQQGTEDGEYIDGLSTVTFTTAEPSLTCLPNPSVHAYVSAGCPPGKTIRARKQVKRETCEYLKNYVYTFERDEYDASYMEGTDGISACMQTYEYDPSYMEGTDGISEDQGLLSIQYDYGTHGCPDRSYYSDGFKPQFDLYIGDKYIEQMDTDYVLFEIHGVHNYDYLMTAKQAGCTRRPQSWVEMLRLQNTTRDPNTAWTRYNYEDCIEANGTRSSERLPYQVMSAESKNKIIWREKVAIYVFNVTVLDPKYSYCSLQTQFAVEVYGALPEPTVSAIRVMLITCALGFAGVAFIFIYYILQLKDAEEEQPTQKIPQFPH